MNSIQIKNISFSVHFCSFCSCCCPSLSKYSRIYYYQISCV